MGYFAIQTSEKWDFGVLTPISQVFSPFLHLAYGQRFRSYEKVQVWAEINCMSGILFADYILPISNNYSKEIFFSFSGDFFACFDTGNPGREFKSWLCVVSKGHSHSQGVPSTWKT